MNTRDFSSRRWAMTPLMVLLLLGLAGSAGAQGLLRYIDDVTKAVEAEDFTKLKTLVKENAGFAQRTAVTMESRIAQMAKLKVKPEDREGAKKIFNMVALTFKNVHRDDTLTKRYKWFNALNDEQLVQRLDAANLYDQAYAEEQIANKEGDEDKRRESLVNYEKSRLISVALKDHYFAGGASLRMMYSYDRLTDYFAAAYYAKLTKQVGEAHGFKNYLDSASEKLSNYDTYTKLKRIDFVRTDLPLEESRLAHRKAIDDSLLVKVPENAGKSSGGGSGKTLVPPKSKAAYDWETVQITKSVIVKKVRYPWYFQALRSNNPHFAPFATRVGFPRDKRVDFGPIPGAKAMFEGKFLIDADGDGKKSAKKAKLKSGKYALLKWKHKNAAGKSKQLAAEIKEVAGEINVMGFEFKVNTTQGTTMLIRGKSGIRAKVRGVEVTIVDSNANGKFNNPGEDTIIVGTGKSARVSPYGRFIFLEENGALYPYEIRVVKGDTAIRTRPYDGDLAPLRIEFNAKGSLEPAFLVAKGDAENSDFFVDVMQAKGKLMWIPVTKLSVHRGAIFVGKGKKEKSILIGRGTSRPFEVVGGKINVWKLGAGKDGFRLASKMERVGRGVSIEGKTVQVFGVAGEEYFNFLTGRILPTIAFRKNDENGSKAGNVTMKDPVRTNEITIVQTFSPGDTLMGKAPRGALVGQMTYKDPIMGPMMSGWIKVQ